jgi:hypothetical protein
VAKKTVVAFIQDDKREDSFSGCQFGRVWAWSSLVNLPVIGSAYGAIANLDPFYAALKKVARLNALAAARAFLSAFFQTFVLYLTR